MPMRFAYSLSILLAAFFLSSASQAGDLYEWSGNECLSDSGDSAYVGKKCSNNGDCPEGLSCINIESSGGFCSLNCAGDSDCGHASKCISSNLDAKMLCIPVSCPDDEKWPDYDDCNAKIAAGETEEDTKTRKECKTVCACDQSHGIDYGAAFAVLALLGLFFVVRFRARSQRQTD